MKKCSLLQALFYRVWILALLFFSHIANAQNQGGNWQILEKGTQKVYVLGTLHFGRADFYPLANEINRALTDADALAVELDLLDPNNAREILALISQTGFIPAGEPLLSEQLNTSIYRALEKTLQDNPAIDQLPRMQPWLVGVLLQAEIGQAFGLESQYGVDRHLLTSAKTHQKPVLSLETIESQMRLFQSLSAESAVKFISETLKNINHDELNKLLKLWRQGEAQMAQYFLTEMRQASPDFYQQGIVTRNQNMAKKIAELNQTCPTLFVGIGALHLYGLQQDSLIDYLYAQDYRS